MSAPQKFRYLAWKANNLLAQRCRRISLSIRSFALSKVEFNGQMNSDSVSLESDELASGITRHEYEMRQEKLVQSIKNSFPNENHVIIVPGSPRRYMIDKIPYFFRQNTDMLYLSGCLETDCVLVIHTLKNSDSFKAVMFTPPHDSSRELWEGPRVDSLSAPKVWPVSESLTKLELLFYINCVQSEARSVIWYNKSEPLNHEMDDFVSSKFSSVQCPKKFIHRLRLIKSPAEIKLMRKTCKISSIGIKKTMENCSAPVSENYLSAAVDFYTRVGGARHLAYPPVVAGGNRANTIHYIDNNNVIQDGELVLMDAGGDYRGYSADITRTWPINGQFSSPQQDLYEGVLEVQEYVLKTCELKPSLDQLYVLMCQKLGKVLQELKILPSDLSKGALYSTVFQYCPHHVSHYLGMDVHDTPTISKSDSVPVGSVITVEPGVYINKKNKTVDKRYLGLGVRIEDDLVITKDGYEILTDLCPKTVADIEKTVGKSR